MVDILATGGHYTEIQAAVDQASEVDNVLLPEGTFNFVDPDEVMITPSRFGSVEIPPGMSLFGSPTERTRGLPYNGMGMNPNNQVVEFKTILVIPAYECAPTLPGHAADYLPSWFHIGGEGDYSKFTRISDIAFVGYREFDINTPQMTIPVYYWNAGTLRVDHCSIRNCAGQGVRSIGLNRGVVDHCSLVNDAGIPTPYGERTVGYGIGHSISTTAAAPYPESLYPPIEDVLGKYTPYTLFVEDCYVSKWRHQVTNTAGHLVFRHNTIQYDFGQGSLDSHEYARAIEVYNCAFLDRVQGAFTGRAIQVRGGGGTFFNNYEDGSYKQFLALNKYPIGPEQVWTKDIWIWNNDVNSPSPLGIYTGPGLTLIEGVDYFLHAPETFAYKPYIYPHPLVEKTISEYVVSYLPLILIGGVLAYLIYRKYTK